MATNDSALDVRAVCLGHTAAVRSVALGTNGARGVSGSEDRTVRVWDLASGVCERVLEGHTNRAWSVAVLPDGTRAVSGSDDGTVRVWDLASGSCAGFTVRPRRKQRPKTNRRRCHRDPCR